MGSRRTVTSVRNPAAPAPVPGGYERTGRAPLVIAHRGASGTLPEHTLPAFAQALSVGADAIEVDVVASADGELIVRHEPELALTSDVELRHDLLVAARARGATTTTPSGLRTHDLTRRELTTLRSRQRAGRPGDFDDLYLVPTLRQVLALARRTVGSPRVHVELKEPRAHLELGLPLEGAVLAELRAHGWDRRGAPVLLQSFDAECLERLAVRTDLPLLQLARLDDDGLALSSDEGLARVAEYADALGVSRALLQVAGDGLVARAAAHSLAVHVFTFADDDPCEADPAGAYADALGLGIAGLITDHPHSARRAVAAWQAAHACTFVPAPRSPTAL